MKKVITILLAAALMLSMAACGNESQNSEMTREEMLEVAQEIKIFDVYEDYFENKAKGEETYLNNVYKISDYITSIESEYIEMSGFQIYLERDVLVTLKTGQKITIVGEINNISQADTTHNFEMKTAYFVDDVFEMTGVIGNLSMSLECAMKLSEIIDSAPFMFFYFVDTSGTTYYVDCELYSRGNVTILGETLTEGDAITITGRLYSVSGTLGQFHTIKNISSIEH